MRRVRRGDARGIHHAWLRRLASARKCPGPGLGAVPATGKSPAGSDPAGPGHISSPPREGEKSSLQRTIDRTELGIEVRAQSVHHRDDGKRDTRRNQTVFDRGRTRLIGQELPENTLQNLPPFGDCDDANNLCINTGNDLKLSKSVQLNSNHRAVSSR